MKIRVNPDVVAGHGGTLRVGLLGKTVASDEEQTVSADEWKMVKDLTASQGGRTLPLWVEVDSAKKSAGDSA